MYVSLKSADGRSILVEADENTNRESGEPGRPLTERASLASREHKAIVPSKKSLEDALECVSTIASVVSTRLEGIKINPSEVELAFNLELNSELSVFSVVKGGSKGSLSVKLKWKQPLHEV